EYRTGDFGGTVSFFHMPGGRWIVRSWRIRMPEFGTRRSDGVQVVSRYATPRLARISEEGGAVPLDVLLNQSGRITGALEGTNDSSMTAMDGTFEMAFVQPGSYTIVLRHPALDSLGIQHLARTLEVDAGRATKINLRLPTNDEIATRMC